MSARQSLAELRAQIASELNGLDAKASRDIANKIGNMRERVMGRHRAKVALKMQKYEHKRKAGAASSSNAETSWAAKVKGRGRSFLLDDILAMEQNKREGSLASNQFSCRSKTSRRKSKEAKTEIKENEVEGPATRIFKVGYDCAGM